MKRLKEKILMTSISVTTLIATTPLAVFADPNPSESDIVTRKIKSGLTIIQTALTALVVAVAVVVSLWIIIKRLPSADDPQEKHEVYKAVGRVVGLCALAAIIIWLLPWVYGLFT